MRILFIADRFPPIGSAAAAALTLGRALARRHEVQVAWGEHEPGPPGLRYDDCEGVRGVRMSLPPPQDLPGTLGLLDRAAGRLLGGYLQHWRPEVIHVLAWGALTPWSAWVAARLGIPTVVTVRDFQPLCHRGTLYDMAGRPCAGPRGGAECLLRGCMEHPAAAYLGAEAPAALAPAEDARPPAPCTTQPLPPWYQALRRMPPFVKNLAPGSLRRAARGRAEGGGEPAAATPAIGQAFMPDSLLPWAAEWRGRFLRETLGLAARVMVTSESLREPVASVLPERMVPLVMPEVMPPRAEPGLAPHAGFTIGYVGRLEPSRRVTDVIKAAGLLGRKDTRLLVIGGGQAEYVGALRQQPQGPETAFLGQVLPEQLEQALTEMDVLVLPGGARQPLPSALALARARGLPVIAAASRDLSRAISDGLTGLLYRPGDVGELASKLGRLADDAELRARLAKSAREMAPDFDQAIGALEAQYRQAAGVEGPR